MGILGAVFGSDDDSPMSGDFAQRRDHLNAQGAQLDAILHDPDVPDATKQELHDKHISEGRFHRAVTDLTEP